MNITQQEFGKKEQKFGSTDVSPFIRQTGDQTPEVILDRSSNTGDADVDRAQLNIKVDYDSANSSPRSRTIDHTEQPQIKLGRLESQPDKANGQSPVAVLNTERLPNESTVKVQDGEIDNQALTDNAVVIQDQDSLNNRECRDSDVKVAAAVDELTLSEHRKEFIFETFEQRPNH